MKSITDRFNDDREPVMSASNRKDDYYDVPKYEKELDKSNTVYDQEQERDKI